MNQPDNNYEFVEICTVDEITPDERLNIEIDNTALILFQIDDQYYAIGDVCTHDNGPLGEGEQEGCCKIVCPRHGARFDIKTGAVKSMPAVKPIPTYPVRVENNLIFIGIPRS